MTELGGLVAKVSAGLSQLFACIIRLSFGTEVFNRNTVGVLLPVASGAIKLYCNLNIVLQDGVHTNEPGIQEEMDQPRCACFLYAGGQL